MVEYSDWPTYSYGIKHIARMVTFRWRDPDPSGVNSIAWYNEYLANPSNDAALTKTLRYNEDDCLAMVAVELYFDTVLLPKRNPARVAACWAKRQTKEETNPFWLRRL